MEGPDEVLALGGVDPRLAADCRVDHPEERGRHLHDPHAAQPGGRDEAREVGGRPASEADDGVAAREAGLSEQCPAARRHGRRLRCLGVRRLQSHHLEAGGLQAGALAASDLREGRWVEQRDPAYVGSEQAGQLAEDVVTHDDVIGRGAVSDEAADADARCGHCVSSFASSREQVVGHVLRRTTVGGHGEGRDLGIERCPGGQKRPQLCADVAEEQRSVPVETDALGGVRQAHVEQGDGLPREPLSCAGVEHGSAAEGQDALVLVERGEHGLALELAEGLLATVDEERRDRRPGERLDVRVGVPEGRLRDAQRRDHRPWSCRSRASRPARGEVPRVSGSSGGRDSREGCAPSPRPRHHRTSRAPRRPGPAPPSPRPRRRLRGRRTRRCAG